MNHSIITIERAELVNFNMRRSEGMMFHTGCLRENDVLIPARDEWTRK